MRRLRGTFRGYLNGFVGYNGHSKSGITSSRTTPLRSASNRHSKKSYSSGLPFKNRAVLAGRTAKRAINLVNKGYSLRGAVSKAVKEIPAAKKIFR